MRLKTYRALDPEGTEIRLMSFEILQPGEKVRDLKDGSIIYTILADKEE